MTPLPTSVPQKQAKTDKTAFLKTGGGSFGGKWEKKDERAPTSAWPLSRQQAWQAEREDRQANCASIAGERLGQAERQAERPLRQTNMHVL